MPRMVKSSALNAVPESIQSQFSLEQLCDDMRDKQHRVSPQALWSFINTPVPASSSELLHSVAMALAVLVSPNALPYSSEDALATLRDKDCRRCLSIDLHSLSLLQSEALHKAARQLAFVRLEHEDDPACSAIVEWLLALDKAVAVRWSLALNSHSFVDGATSPRVKVQFPATPSSLQQLFPGPKEHSTGSRSQPASPRSPHDNPRSPDLRHASHSPSPSPRASSPSLPPRPSSSAMSLAYSTHSSRVRRRRSSSGDEALLCDTSSSSSSDGDPLNPFSLPSPSPRSSNMGASNGNPVFPGQADLTIDLTSASILTSPRQQHTPHGQFTPPSPPSKPPPRGGSSPSPGRGERRVDAEEAPSRSPVRVPTQQTPSPRETGRSPSKTRRSPLESAHCESPLATACAERDEAVSDLEDLQQHLQRVSADNRKILSKLMLTDQSLVNTQQQLSEALEERDRFKVKIEQAEQRLKDSLIDASNRDEKLADFTRKNKQQADHILKLEQTIVEQKREFVMAQAEIENLKTVKRRKDHRPTLQDIVDGSLSASSSDSDGSFHVQRRRQRLDVNTESVGCQTRAMTGTVHAGCQTTEWKTNSLPRARVDSSASSSSSDGDAAPRSRLGQSCLVETKSSQTVDVAHVAQAVQTEAKSASLTAPVTQEHAQIIDQHVRTATEVIRSITAAAAATDTKAELASSSVKLDVVALLAELKEAQTQQNSLQRLADSRQREIEAFQTLSIQFDGGDLEQQKAALVASMQERHAAARSRESQLRDQLYTMRKERYRLDGQREQLEGAVARLREENAKLRSTAKNRLSGTG